MQGNQLAQEVKKLDAKVSGTKGGQKPKVSGRMCKKAVGLTLLLYPFSLGLIRVGPGKEGLYSVR